MLFNFAFIFLFFTFIFAIHWLNNSLLFVSKVVSYILWKNDAPYEDGIISVDQASNVTFAPSSLPRMSNILQHGRREEHFSTTCSHFSCVFSLKCRTKLHCEN